MYYQSNCYGLVLRLAQMSMRAQAAISKKDYFIAKMSISSKEARECKILADAVKR